VEDYYDDVKIPGSRLNMRFHGDREDPRNKGGLLIMSGCGSMKDVVGWFRGSRDAYFEAYEVDDEEFLEGAGGSLG
jgi:hypothetical protein